jgi:hypothetical protein
MVMRRGHNIRIPLPRRKLQPEEYDQALLWLKTSPEYRELIRQRISDEQKRRRLSDARVRHPAPDHDTLGREVEGCG